MRRHIIARRSPWAGPTHPAMGLRRLTAVVALALAAACNADQLQVPNENNVTEAGAQQSPVQSLRFLATGFIASHRNGQAGHVRDISLFGREAWYFQLQDSRWTTGYFRDYTDNVSFGAGGSWGGPFGNLRNIQVFKGTVAGAPITAAEKAAALGFAQTYQALEMLRVILTRDSIGMPVEIGPEATDLFDFVSRDSAYARIVAVLDSSNANLGAGGSAFPFPLPAGMFTGLENPSTFRQFNRALMAKVQAYRGSLGCSTCYSAANTALGQSFLPASLTASNRTAGAQLIFSAAPGDVQNGLWSIRNDLYANEAFRAGLPATDLRMSKFLTGQPSRSQGGSDASSTRFSVYPTNVTNMPLLDVEELWLLRAEIKWFTGNTAGAIQSLNDVATVVGGATEPRYSATTITNNAQFIDALLQERALSLMLEGHRWIDMRRFNRLSSLPLGGPGFTVARRQVVPQAECIYRATIFPQGTPAQKGPGC